MNVDVIVTKMKYYCIMILLLVNVTPKTANVDTGIYERKQVGYATDLVEYIMDTTNMISRRACGKHCHTKGCISFTYDVATLSCTLYNVYMSGTGSLMDNYYVKVGAVDAASVHLQTTTAVNGDDSGEQSEDLFPNPSCRSTPFNVSLTNVALGKPVDMSTAYTEDTTGSLAVNGLCEELDQCAQTKKEINPYLIIDLGQTYIIHTIYVRSKQDFCLLCALSFNLGESLTSWVSYTPIMPGPEYTLVFQHTQKARYVGLSMLDMFILPRMVLCEVEVYTSDTVG